MRISVVLSLSFVTLVRSESSQGRCVWGDSVVGSILGRNIAYHADKDLNECKALCDGNAACQSMEHNANTKECYLGGCRIGKECSNSGNKDFTYQACGKDPLWLDIEGQGGVATQVNQAHGGAASRAIDGNAASSWRSGSCTHTHHTNDPWWQVKFNQKMDFTDVAVTNRGDCCGEWMNGGRGGPGFSVLVDNKPCASGIKIKQGETMVVPCVGSGDTVKIQIPGRRAYLMIAEVKVGVNGDTTTITTTPSPIWLDLKGKTATQASTAYGGRASRAIDGNTRSDWRGGSCTHTHRTSNTWWQVDLGAVTNVSTVQINNRADCCGERLRDAKITIDDKPCADHVTGPGKTRWNTGTDCVGQKLKIQMMRREYLMLCEVKVGKAGLPNPPTATTQTTTTTAAPVAKAPSGPPTTSTSCQPGVCDTGAYKFFMGDMTEAACKAMCDDGRRMVSEGGIQEDVYQFRQNGQFHDLKVLKTKTLKLSRKVANINYRGSGGDWPGVRGLRDHFYVRWSGFLIIKSAGTYTFTTSSDDGSRLFLDGGQVVDNPGWHGMRERHGNAILEPGNHVFAAEFFEGGGGAGMIVYYKGPDSGNSKIIIPTDKYLPPAKDGEIAGKMVIASQAWKEGICQAYSHTGSSCILYSACQSISDTEENICGDKSINLLDGPATGFKTCMYTAGGNKTTNATS